MNDTIDTFSLDVFEPAQRTALLSCVRANERDLAAFQCLSTLTEWMDGTISRHLEAEGAGQALQASLQPVARLFYALWNRAEGGLMSTPLPRPGIDAAPISVRLALDLNAVARSRPALLGAPRAFLARGASGSDVRMVSVLDCLLCNSTAPDVERLETGTAQLVLNALTPGERRFVIETLAHATLPYNTFMLLRLQDRAGLPPSILDDIRDCTLVEGLAYSAASALVDGFQARELLGRLAERGGEMAGTVSRSKAEPRLAASFMKGLCHRGLNSTTSVYRDLESMVVHFNRLERLSADDGVRSVAAGAVAAVACCSSRPLWHKQSARLVGLDTIEQFDLLETVGTHLERHGKLTRDWVFRMEEAFSPSAAAPVHARLRELAMRTALASASDAPGSLITPRRRSRSV